MWKCLHNPQHTKSERYIFKSVTQELTRKSKCQFLGLHGDGTSAHSILNVRRVTMQPLSHASSNRTLTTSSSSLDGWKKKTKTFFGLSHSVALQLSLRNYHFKTLGARSTQDSISELRSDSPVFSSPARDARVLFQLLMGPGLQHFTELLCGL